LLEELLMGLKEERQHLGLVFDKAGRWSGLVTLGDVTEEIIGRVSDEFEPAPSMPLGALTPARVTLDLEATSIDGAIARATRIGTDPRWAEPIMQDLAGSGGLTFTNLGNGLAVSHGVVETLDRAVTFFARSDGGIPLEASVERIHGLFIVLLPTRMHHVESEVVEGLASLMESEYLRERLLQAETPAAVMETLHEGMQVAPA
jgi:mannitol/fructose-specific phosphotransferase system IIA component (Ntr-type)